MSCREGGEVGPTAEGCRVGLPPPGVPIDELGPAGGPVEVGVLRDLDPSGVHGLNITFLG